MRAGAARTDITPDYPTDLAGFFVRTQPALGVADRIWARVAVFDNGTTRLVLVSLEVLEMPPAMATAWRQEIAIRLSTRPECVCITCVHTHSAPVLYPLRECGRISERFIRDLEDRVLRCAEEAAADLVPVRLSAGAAPLRLGIKRKGELRDERVDSIEDAAAEDTLRVLSATDDRGRVRVGLLHYACHPVCVMADNRHISGDYPGMACRELEHRLGNGAVFLFFNGCAGDINPRPEFLNSYEGAHRAGMMLADAAVPLLKDGVLLGEDALAASSTVQPLAYEPPNEEAWRERIASLERRIERAASNSRADTGWLRAGQNYYADMITRARRGEYPPHMDVTVQHLRIGPVEMVAFSGEVFFELARQIRAATARPDLWLPAYCNGGEGYIPTKAAYEAGGYEVDCSHWFYDRPRLLPGEGERLIVAAIAELTAE